MKKFHPSPEEDHFGLITFNKRAELAFTFADSKYHDKEALVKRIADEPIRLRLHTRTDLALKLALDSLFTKAGGDRPDKPNVMIVLTDGMPTHPGKSFSFDAFAANIEKEFKVSVPIQVSLTCHMFFNLFFSFCGTNKRADNLKRWYFIMQLV